MDDTVDEVFRSMLDQSCAVVDDDARHNTDISAHITLSGEFDALCIVEFPASSAEKLTRAFLGSGEANWDDSMIADAVGELCNMIAGGWKKRLGKSAWAADLSTPSVCRGCSHKSGCNSHDQRTRVRRVYAFGQSTFAVCLAAL